MVVEYSCEYYGSQHNYGHKWKVPYVWNTSNLQITDALHVGIVTEYAQPDVDHSLTIAGIPSGRFNQAWLTLTNNLGWGDTDVTYRSQRLLQQMTYIAISQSGNVGGRILVPSHYHHSNVVQ